MHSFVSLYPKEGKNIHQNTKDFMRRNHSHIDCQKLNTERAEGAQGTCCFWLWLLFSPVEEDGSVQRKRL